VPTAEIVAEPAAESAPASMPSSATTAQPLPGMEDNPVFNALKATLAAEGLQREAMRIQREIEQRPPASPPPVPARIEQHIDALPISEHKRAFLRSNPEMLEPSRARALAENYAAAMKAGISDDSPELDEYLLAGVARDQERHHAPPPPIERTLSPNAPAPSRRPSMPMTAPPSREVPMSNGQFQSDNRVTLSAEERQMAHLSYRDLAPTEAEALYARQKLRLVRERAAGRYPLPERG
jgi:hypothetical protein